MKIRTGLLRDDCPIRWNRTCIQFLRGNSNLSQLKTVVNMVGHGVGPTRVLSLFFSKRGCQVTAEQIFTATLCCEE